MQNQMVILRGVLKVKFTKYCTCAAKNPGELPELSRPWTGFFISLGLEPYMLVAYGAGAEVQSCKYKPMCEAYGPQIVFYAFVASHLWRTSTPYLDKLGRNYSKNANKGSEGSLDALFDF